MSASNFWNSGEQRRYLRTLHNIERARDAKLRRARKRLDDGTYLTEAVALATARKILGVPDKPPP